MKVSAKTRYAARILLALANGEDGRPVSSSLVAQRTGVTVQFTEQILKDLKRGGLTTSLRGATGGHLLTRSPEYISLAEIVCIMEGGVQLAACLSSKEVCSGIKDTPSTCERADSCAMRIAWGQVTLALEKTLAGISLADLLTMRDGDSLLEE